AFTEIFNITLRTQIPYSGRTDRAIARDLLSSHDVENSTENWQRLLAGYLARLPASLNLHMARVLPCILATLGARHKRNDVVIGRLRGNVRAAGRLKLGPFGLFDRFALGAFGDHHFDRDDVAREALDAVRSPLGSEPKLERVFVIGDTPLDVK